jgi:3-hydroxyacyl-CoA dehydrogenase
LLLRPTARTADPNFAVRPVLRRLVHDGYVGAVAEKGWYDLQALTLAWSADAMRS